MGQVRHRLRADGRSRDTHLEANIPALVIPPVPVTHRVLVIHPALVIPRVVPRDIRQEILVTRRSQEVPATPRDLDIHRVPRAILVTHRAAVQVIPQDRVVIHQVLKDIHRALVILVAPW